MCVCVYVKCMNVELLNAQGDNVRERERKEEREREKKRADRKLDKMCMRFKFPFFFQTIQCEFGMAYVKLNINKFANYFWIKKKKIRRGKRTSKQTGEEQHWNILYKHIFHNSPPLFICVQSDGFSCGRFILSVVL